MTIKSGLKINNKSLDEHDQNVYNNYYHLYQYTDDIVVISNCDQYPDIMNYLKTGLLNEEEIELSLKDE